MSNELQRLLQAADQAGTAGDHARRTALRFHALANLAPSAEQLAPQLLSVMGREEAIEYLSALRHQVFVTIQTWMLCVEMECRERGAR